MMSIDKITIVISDEDFGDVSFQDEYSAKVFDNTYNSMYGECGLVNLTDLSIVIESDWAEYFEARKGSGVTHTLEYYLAEDDVRDVVQMLESLYTVEIVHIQSTGPWDGGVVADLGILEEDESC